MRLSISLFLYIFFLQACATFTTDAQRMYNVCKMNLSEFTLLEDYKAMFSSVGPETATCHWTWDQDSQLAANRVAESHCNRHEDAGTCYLYATSNGREDWVQYIANNKGIDPYAEYAAQNTASIITTGVALGLALSGSAAPPAATLANNVPQEPTGPKPEPYDEDEYLNTRNTQPVTEAAYIDPRCLPVPNNCAAAQKSGEDYVIKLQRSQVGVHEEASKLYCALLVEIEAYEVCRVDYLNSGNTFCADLAKQQIEIDEQNLAAIADTAASASSINRRAACDFE